MNHTTENHPAPDNLDRQIAGSIARRLDAQRGRARDAFMQMIANEPAADPIPITRAVPRSASRVRWFIGGSVGIAAAAALAIAMISPVDRPAVTPNIPANQAMLPQVRHTIAWDTHEAAPVIVNERSTARSFERQRVDRFRWYDQSLGANVEVTVPSREIMLANWPTH